ncbi:histidine N-acetyltransferase-like [Branchiostoma floridae]|uniref:Histidine N-acetyltransferase-like n=2 Tax=Branchiostoma floridae TaxID=7739 RepID=A0A9J7N9W6_BRAFL|nr:histidine N-acetyltransferase-like [Branchiostoma floridae]
MSVQEQGQDQDILANLQIRDAMHVDYDAVLTLESGRHGYDYLPALYHPWVDNPAVTLSLAWTEEKVLVAVMVTWTDDTGETIYLKTFRISPDWRGRGLSIGLRRLLLTKLFKESPKLRTFRTMVDAKAPQLIKRLGLAVKSKFKVETIFFKSDVEALSDKLEDLERSMQSTVSTIKPFKNMDMKRMLADEFTSKILPERTVLDDTDPYSFSLPNMKTLEERKCYILVDRSGPAVRSLSVGGSYTTSRGTVYYFAIHCKDRQLAKSHLVLQTKRACSDHRGNVTFIVTVTDSSLTEDLVSYCKEAMGLKGMPYGGTHELLESRSLVWEERKI